MPAYFSMTDVKSISYFLVWEHEKPKKEIT